MAEGGFLVKFDGCPLLCGDLTPFIVSLIVKIRVRVGSGIWL